MTNTKVSTIALLLCSVAASCAPLPGMRPMDTGNMAMPQPMAPGNLSTTTAVQGPRDTGNMAFPTPSPAGNLRSTVVQ